jgi:hypothetical protein
MRHFIASCTVTASALGMSEAPAATVLIALASFADAGAPGGPCTVGSAIDLTAIAAATNEHLRPAAGTQKEAARGLHPTGISFGHRRSLWNAEEGSISTGRASRGILRLHASLCQAPWPRTRVLCRRDIGVKLAVCRCRAGCSAVRLSTGTRARCHLRLRFARLHSPYGLPPPRKASRIHSFIDHHTSVSQNGRLEPQFQNVVA